MSRTYGKAQDLIDFTRASSGTALRRVKYGAELVTNGTFDSDVSGWYGVSAGVVSHDSTNNALKVTANAGDNFAAGETTISTVAGAVYKLDVDIISFSGINVQIGIATTSNGVDISLSNQTDLQYSVIFVAQSATTYIKFGTNDTSGLSHNAVFDNISVKEVTFDTSDGDLVLFNHPNNIPRIEYDANGNLLGLLVEEARTNLIAYSEDFANAAWEKFNVTTSLDNGTAPDDGDMTLLTVSEAVVNVDSAIRDTTTITVGQTYTASVFVRRDQNRFAMLYGFGNGGTGIAFDLLNGVAQVNGSWESAGIEIISDTIARIYGVVIPASSNVFYIGLASSLEGNKVFSGGETLSFWGAQIEAGSFPTSYIPTSGSTATRSADVASLSTSAFGYNGNEGTFFVEYQRQYAEPADGTFPKIIHVDDGTGNNRIFAQGVPSSVNMTIATYSGGASTSLSPAVAFASSNKIAISVDSEASFKFVINGSASGSIATNIVDLSLLTSVSIGLNLLGPSQQINGHIKALKYIPRELTDSQLEALTA